MEQGLVTVLPTINITFMLTRLQVLPSNQKNVPGRTSLV